MDKKQKIIEMLKDIRPDVSFETETDLAIKGYLDSVDIVTFVSNLEDEFKIFIPVAEITPQNFYDVRSIIKLVDNCGK